MPTADSSPQISLKEVFQFLKVISFIWLCFSFSLTTTFSSLFKIQIMNLNFVFSILLSRGSYFLFLFVLVFYHTIYHLNISNLHPINLSNYARSQVSNISYHPSLLIKLRDSKKKNCINTLYR